MPCDGAGHGLFGELCSALNFGRSWAWHVCASIRQDRKAKKNLRRRKSWSVRIAFSTLACLESRVLAFNTGGRDMHCYDSRETCSSI